MLRTETWADHSGNSEFPASWTWKHIKDCIRNFKCVPSDLLYCHSRTILHTWSTYKSKVIWTSQLFIQTCWGLIGRVLGKCYVSTRLLALLAPRELTSDTQRTREDHSLILHHVSRLRPENRSSFFTSWRNCETLWTDKMHDTSECFVCVRVSSPEHHWETAVLCERSLHQRGGILRPQIWLRLHSFTWHRCVFQR